MLRTHMEPYEVSKEQLEFFHENGFLLLKKVWNKEDIDVIRKDLDEAAKDNFTVRLDMHFHKSIKLAHRSKKMCDIGDAICNGRAIPLASTTFFCKPNNPKEYGSIWHQDNFAPMAPNGDNYLNLAIIVDDADKSNGSLVIIPGSHKLGMLSFKPTPNFSYDADGNLVQSAPIGDAKKLSDYTDSTGNNLPDDLPKLQLEYEAGDILVIHGLLLHKADKNPHPSKWRRTIYSVYIKENEPFWPGWTAKRQLLNRYDSPEKVKKQMSCFKFGYTHINKCAGTSVHHWLTANNLLATYGTSGDHLVRSSADLLSFDPKIVNIITVRNPYNRIYSIFKQWEKNGWLKNDMKLPEFIRLLPECYEENNCGKIVGVYENWFGTPPDESPVGIRMIKPCSYWLKDLNKFKIFKLENLQALQDFFINNDYNIEVDISTIRVLSTVTDGEGSYLHKFDQEEKDIIEKLFHSDFVNFGYEKDL